MPPLFITFNRKSWQWGRLGLRLGEIKAVNGPSLLLAFLYSHPDTPAHRKPLCSGVCPRTASRTKEQGSNLWPHIKEAPRWVTLHVYFIMWRTTRCLCVYLWTERRWNSLKPLVFSLAVSSLTCWVTLIVILGNVGLSQVSLSVPHLLHVLSNLSPSSSSSYCVQYLLHNPLRIASVLCLLYS